MPFVISDTIDAATVGEALEVLKSRRQLGHSVECTAEQTAEFLAAQLRDYRVESAS